MTNDERTTQLLKACQAYDRLTIVMEQMMEIGRAHV